MSISVVVTGSQVTLDSGSSFELEMDVLPDNMEDLIKQFVDMNGGIVHFASGSTYPEPEEADLDDDDDSEEVDEYSHRPSSSGYNPINKPVVTAPAQTGYKRIAGR